MTSDQILTWMRARGWDCDVHEISGLHDTLVVVFSRSDWHDQQLVQPFSVSHTGPVGEREDLILRTAREAERVYRAFPSTPPGTYFDLETNELYWDTPERTVLPGERIVHGRVQNMVPGAANEPKE